MTIQDLEEADSWRYPAFHFKNPLIYVLGREKDEEAHQQFHQFLGKNRPTIGPGLEQHFMFPVVDEDMNLVGHQETVRMYFGE